jgi:hypothetical protein
VAALIVDMRQLPFGARISDSFIELLRRQIVKAHREMPGASPCLCAQENLDYQALSRGEAQALRFDLSKVQKIVPVNRLARPVRLPKRVISKQRLWVLRFDRREHSADATFNIDGMQLHISKRAQAELKDAAIFSVLGEIVVKYVRI